MSPTTVRVHEANSQPSCCLLTPQSSPLTHPPISVQREPQSLLDLRSPSQPPEGGAEPTVPPSPKVTPTECGLFAFNWPWLPAWPTAGAGPQVPGASRATGLLTKAHPPSSAPAGFVGKQTGGLSLPLALGGHPGLGAPRAGPHHPAQPRTEQRTSGNVEAERAPEPRPEAPGPTGWLPGSKV